MPVAPSGVPNRESTGAPSPSADQSTASWLVPLVIGSAVTAGLAVLMTPAGAAVVAPTLGAGTFGALGGGAAGAAAAGTGGAVSQQIASKAMGDEPPEYNPSPQLQQLATKPLGKQRQAMAGPNPKMLALKRGYARAGQRVG